MTIQRPVAQRYLASPFNFNCSVPDTYKQYLIVGKLGGNFYIQGVGKRVKETLMSIMENKT